MGPLFYFVFFGAEVMINRDTWWHACSMVRNEALGFDKDGLQRKPLPRLFSLIKSERQGIEHDQITS